MLNPKLRKLIQMTLLVAASVGIQEVIAQSNAPRLAKIGYVDADRILRESLPAKLARAKIEADFAPRQREIEATIAKNQQAAEAFDRDSPALAETERARRQMDVLNADRRIQRLQRAYSDDLSQRKSNELGVLQDNTNKAIRRIAVAENYDLIVQQVTYFNPRIDLTDKVIEELAAAAKANP